MTGDLQASVEFAVEFQTFHNVDLFQRGYYQIRCSVKPPVKVPTSIELEQKVDAETEVRGNEYQFPAMTSLSGQTAISKTFQILYRNETIILNDIFVFRLNMLVNSDKIVQEIDQADFQMTVELFFSDSDYGSDITDSMASVSSQTLKLHMSCVKGLHHHVPILFDYYHFAVIDTTIHATMTGLGLPDNSVVRPGKNSWFAKPPSNVRVSTPTFFVTLFSNKALAPSSSKTSLVEKQLQFAYDTHRSLCSTLLSAQINLLAYFQCLSELLPDNQRINIDMVDFGEKLDELCSSVEATVACEETFSQVCSNLNNLSTELHLAWSQFLEFFTLNKATFPFLRTEHHKQRISHLSEAFFVKEHQWDELQKPQDQNTFQQHQSLAQSVKGSRYYQCIPPVQVECPLLDGDTSSIPIIFEDKYSFSLSSETDPGSNTELDDILFTLDQDEVDNIGDESYLVISDNGSDEADDNSATSQDVSEKGVQGTETEQTLEAGSTVEEPNETKTASLEEVDNAGKENSAQCDSSAEPPGEAAQSQGEAAQPHGEATQPQGEAAQPQGEAAQPKGEAAQSIESDSENERSESKEQLIEKPDTSSVHEKTDSAVTEEAEKKRTSEVQISDECENEGSSDTEESDFVDAEALNGVEMLPSSLGEEIEGVSGDNATKETTKTDDSEGQTSSESKGASNENVALPTVTDSEDQNGENENSNEDTEEPELLLTTDGSEDDLLPSSTDAAADADSSNYETPRSSEASPSTTSDSPTEVVTTQPTVNGAAPSGTSETDNVPVAPRRKKKKAVPKGLSSSSLGACFPMNCAGNTSPAFNLSRGESVYGGSVRSRFEIAKRFVKRSLNYACQIYSDRHLEGNREPYFSAQPPDSLQTHLIVCVHGLDGNSGDLRLLRCYLEMGLPSTRMDFLMSEVNQPDTFVTFEEMTDKLVQEIAHHIEAYNLFPTKISFIGHSLGNIIIRSALTHPEMRPFLDKVHTFLSLSGPHLGMLYPTSSLVSTGLWFMQKWKKSDSLLQLSLHDHPDPRQTFIYRLSCSQGLQYFKNILLVSSVQDHYVPYHSARIEPCRQATRDNSEIGIAYREMIDNLLKPLEDRKDMNFVRYSVYHNLPSSANSLIGRAAHIAMLDSELFIEKLLLVSAVDYFR